MDLHDENAMQELNSDTFHIGYMDSTLNKRVGGALLRGTPTQLAAGADDCVYLNVSSRPSFRLTKPPLRLANRFDEINLTSTEGARSTRGT